MCTLCFHLRKLLEGSKKELDTAAKRLVIVRILAWGISQNMLTLTASWSARAKHDVATDGRGMLHICIPLCFPKYSWFNVFDAVTFQLLSLFCFSFYLQNSGECTLCISSAFSKFIMFSHGNFIISEELEIQTVAYVKINTLFWSFIYLFDEFVHYLSWSNMKLV